MASKVEYLRRNWIVKLRLGYQTYSPGCMCGWMDGWMNGWMDVKAVLGIACSNQKSIPGAGDGT